MSSRTEPGMRPYKSWTSPFDAFYRARYPDALRLAWLLTHCSEAAEDAVQEAFLALYVRFDSVEVPRAYLDRSIVYQCRSWLRRERVRHLRTMHVEERWEDTALHDVSLVAAVSRLPYRQRVVIVMRYWGDCSEAEIAAALSCKPGTVKSLNARALDRLRKEVGNVPT